MSGFIRFVIVVGLLVGFGAVAWHSLGEIHYLKTFYPSRFSVQETFYASWVEVAKLVVVGLPLGLTVMVLILWRGQKE